MENKVVYLHPNRNEKGMKKGGEPPMSLEARVAKLESDVGHIQTIVSDIKLDLNNFKTETKSDFIGVSRRIDDARGEIRTEARSLTRYIITLGIINSVFTAVAVAIATVIMKTP